MRKRPLIISLIVVVVAATAGFLWWQSRNQPRMGEAAYAHTQAILKFGPRPPGSDGLKAVRGYLRAQLETSGWVTAGQAFDHPTSNGTIRFENVRARFPGAGGDPWQRPVTGLLGAHVDSKWFKDEVFLGADDSASACGAILEIARVLAVENPAQAAQLELVFFDGEEAFGRDITAFDGLFGSRHYASKLRDHGPLPQFGIVLDIIGHKDQMIKLPADTPEALRDAVLAAAKKEGAAARYGIRAGPVMDDHVPLNLAGVPTVDIIGDFSPDRGWHTPADTIQNISPAVLDTNMRVALRVLRERLKAPK